MTDVASVAGAAEKVVEGVMKIEPMIAAGVGMLVPGAAPIVAMVQPEVLMAAPYVERALTGIAAPNGGDAFAAFIAFLQHLTPGQPNAATLAPEAAPTPAINS